MNDDEDVPVQRLFPLMSTRISGTCEEMGKTRMADKKRQYLAILQNLAEQIFKLKKRLLSSVLCSQMIIDHGLLFYAHK